MIRPKEAPLVHVRDEEGRTCYVLCGVEGCPRTTTEGNEAENVACGLSTLDPLHGESPHCGSTRTLDAWESEGLWP